MIPARIRLPWRLALLATVLPASAWSDVVWTAGPGANQHRYRLVSVASGINWDAAALAAQALGGSLATARSANENSFVFALAAQHASAWFVDPAGHARGPWLGGFQPAGSPEPGGGWQWLNGEGAFTFAAWAPNQPNDSGGSESRLQYYSPNAAADRLWNDASPTALALGYLVEWAPSPVPETSPAALIGCGLAMMAFLSRSRRQ